MSNQQEPTIAPAQLERMLHRYTATIAAYFQQMGETRGDRQLDLANSAAKAALVHLESPRDQATAQHLTGFVQGVLLCKGLCSWEYLATDDRRV